MHEVEIKLRVPPHARTALLAWLRASARPLPALRLHAVYWDTPARDLAQAGMALRMRREGRRWVQTLKGLGADAVTRLEHEVPRRGTAATAPAVDPALHAGTEVGDRLLALLQALTALAPPSAHGSTVRKADSSAHVSADVSADAGGPEAMGGPEEADPVAPPTSLRARYETVVRRQRWSWASPWGEVMFALDQGEVRAGAVAEALCELEIEHAAGSTAAVFDAAIRVLEAAPGIWLDLRTKAHRGDALAQGVEGWPVVKAGRVELPRQADTLAAARGVLAQTLAHALGNAQVLAAGEGGPVHLHQLRVALRRSRTALRLFGAALPFDTSAWQAQAGDLFRRLGAARDVDALAASLLPALAAAGAPPVVLPHEHVAPVDVPLLVREPGWQQLWLQWLAFAHGLTPPASAGMAMEEGLPEASDRGAEESVPPSVPASRRVVAARPWVRDRLRRWWRAVRRDVRRFQALDEEAWHRLRKRVKRLRYAAEFAAAWYPARAVGATLREMAQVQDAMGELNDVITALVWYRQAALQDPQALFAVGWLTARRDELRRRVERRLRRWVRQRPFWRG